MCNQYLLSDLRLQTRGSKAGAVLAASGAVLAALEPPRPGLGRRKGAGLWNRGGGLWNRGGALEQRWGSGPPLRAREAPSERPGAHAVTPSAWAPKSADPAATEHEQADALRPGRAAAQPHVRGLAARGGRRPRHRPAAPPGREANHVAANRVLLSFLRVEAGGNQAAGVAPHFGDGVRAPWSYTTTFRYDTLSTPSSRDCVALGRCCLDSRLMAHAS